MSRNAANSLANRQLVELSVAGSIADPGRKLTIACEQIAKADKVESAAGVFYSNSPPVRAEEVCVLFPGQGSRAPNMLRILILAIRNCNRYLQPRMPKFNRF